MNRINISMSNACNLSCKYCHLKLTSEISGELSWLDAKKILDNVIDFVEEKNIRPFKIGLVGSGEPLMCYDLITEIVKYSKNFPKLSLYTITNGTLFNDEMAQFFFEHRGTIHIDFSLDGPKKIHDAHRHFSDSRGTFDNILNSISIYEKHFGSKPKISCTVHKETIEWSKEVLDYFKDNGFKHICFSRYIGPRESQYWISQKEFDKFIYEAQTRGFILRQTESFEKYDCVFYGKKCGVGISNIYFSDGFVYPCARFIGMSEFILGDYKTPLHDIVETMKKKPNIAPMNKCYYDYLFLK